MANTMPDNCLLLWLQKTEDYPFTTKTALGNMYEYFKPAESEDGTTTKADDNAESGKELLDLLKADDQRHCFLTFREKESGQSTALLFHHMDRYPSRIGDKSPFSGRWYLTGGQPVGGVHITYDVPEDLFSITVPTQVYTIERSQRELAHDMEAVDLVPEVNTENVSDLEIVTTRRSMWIPNQSAALCLDEDMSPVDIYNVVYGAMIQDGVVNECQPLLDFLRVQLIGANKGNSAIFLEDELRTLVRMSATWSFDSTFKTSIPFGTSCSLNQ